MGMNDLWLPQRIAGPPLNLFQRWLIGDYLPGQIVESWKSDETITLNRSDSTQGTLGLIVRGAATYWIEYRKSPMNLNGVTIYRSGSPDDPNFTGKVTLLQTRDKSPSGVLRNGLLQKNEVFVSEDGGIRIEVVAQEETKVSLRILRSKTLNIEEFRGQQDVAALKIGDLMRFESSFVSREPIIEIRLSGRINSNLKRLSMHPWPAHDFSTEVPTSAVWGTVNDLAFFQTETLTTTINSGLRAVGFTVTGTQVDLTKHFFDSVEQAKVEAEAKAKADAEARAKAEADAKSKAEAEAKAKADAEAGAEITAKSSSKVTIICIKGSKIKKITAKKPKCPSGFKKKLS